MADYVDQMDVTRVVRPLQTQTNASSDTVEVQVFWRQRKGDQEVRVPGGKAFIPRRLLLTGEEHQYDARARVGFIPDSKAAPLPKLHKKVKVKAAPRRDEENEDW